MKTERIDRKKTFNQMINTSNNVVADELMFTASNDFFKDMTREDIKRWSDVCMEFVYNDLGYKKEQVLHSTIHLDEKTPHIHCVVVPLIKKFDKRTNSERFTISKKQYIRDKIHLSELQDKYHARLVSNGFDLERGIKGSDRKHIKIKEYKQINKKLERDLNVRNESLDNALNEFEEKMKTTKNTLIDKEYVKVKKDTFDSMKKVINETKKVMELEPKIDKVFKDINNYSNSYNTLTKDNQKYQKEISSLKEKNKKLEQENRNLKSYIQIILESLKKFFKNLLHIGNDKTLDKTASEIKQYYDDKDFSMYDVKDIAVGTKKEDELFEYANIPKYYKEFGLEEKHFNKDKGFER